MCVIGRKGEKKNKSSSTSEPYNTHVRELNILTFVPISVESMLRFCVIQDVFPGPVGDLFPTQEESQLMR